MKSFNIKTHTDEVYARYPEAVRRPVIGITANYADGDATIREQYYMQIVRAGGVPLMIPPVADKDVILNTLDRIDALLLTGGGDINPLWTGCQPEPALGHINARRDLPELLITLLACNRQMPVLGICRGIQTIVTALGGVVRQDIGAGAAIKHSQDADRTEPTHSVDILPDSLLHDICGAETIYVNSFHHQVVETPGEALRVTATAPDGIIEAVESTRHQPVMGVQWHPEWLGDDGLPLFRWLVDEAALYARARNMHHHMLTLDSHCDTPMFFPEGACFVERDPRILVDLHKMTDGMLDAVTMVAYLPQPAEGETFADVAPFGIASPKDYADLIFDKIHETVGMAGKYIAVARTPDELRVNKRMGRKSVMLGIENGLALNHDLSNLGHFARRGVTYVTLCHNGDNDICDSARRTKQTHGGVSPFGREVIREMNRLGLMVDLSHAAESSFYDALDISATPIVCSHSCCKALCDVPRNLGDDQLRALARKGGVAQITLYHGFLRARGDASIDDFMAHLLHAIDVAGIDHVGVGTDFDGDGGVSGLQDASQLINITRRLLRRHFSPADIEKIWGGNWLRVMRTVQEAATAR